MSGLVRCIHDASERVWGTWWLEIANIGILFGIAFMFLGATLFEQYGFGLARPLSVFITIDHASIWAVLATLAAGLLLTVLGFGGLDVRALALGATALIYFGIGTQLALTFGGNFASACYISMGCVSLAACGYSAHRMWTANCQSKGRTAHVPP